MNNSRAKLVTHLESKRRLFQDMEKTLIEQENLLKKKEFDGFRDKSEMIDSIIEKIKNIDYDIARLESDDTSLSRMAISGDDEIKKILDGIIKISKRNYGLMDELAEILNKSYQDLKEKLGDTVEMSKISGYKTSTQPSPVYFDKTS
ncbi:MAG: hypothetical protein JSU85_07400 [Candidatus Zixiibacteriota bacterium]|nr:MAG: hypothetical protein JSU85_07400 [candidate division Zixibacteria bacterium]